MSFAKEANLQRTCWKCEGSVSEHVPECPYCGAFLQDPPNPSESFASCHLSFPESPATNDPEGLFSVSSSDWESVLNDQPTPPKIEPQESKESHWLQHWPTASVFLGCGLLAFAFLLLLFATDAGLSLVWPKNRAYICGVLGGIFAYFGYTKIQ